jgi:hypothetical protein
MTLPPVSGDMLSPRDRASRRNQRSFRCWVMRPDGTVYGSGQGVVMGEQSHMSRSGTGSLYQIRETPNASNSVSFVTIGKSSICP